MTCGRAGSLTCGRAGSLRAVSLGHRGTDRLEDALKEHVRLVRGGGREGGKGR